MADQNDMLDFDCLQDFKLDDDQPLSAIEDGLDLDFLQYFDDTKVSSEKGGSSYDFGALDIDSIFA